MTTRAGDVIRRGQGRRLAASLGGLDLAAAEPRKAEGPRHGRRIGESARRIEGLADLSAGIAAVRRAWEEMDKP